MKVFLYAGRSPHPFYREQVRAVPPGVEIVGSTELHATGLKADIARSASPAFRAVRWLKRSALQGIVKAGVPNVRYFRAPACDLIHSAPYPLLNSTPWVVDFEDVSVFAWYDPQCLAQTRVRRLLQWLFTRASCRGILPWTEAARESLANALSCGPFSHKIKVVYPAIRPSVRSLPSASRVRLLFVGSAFYYKGGLETLLAFARLRQKLPLDLTIVSLVPPEVRARFERMPGLTIRSRIDPMELEQLYRTTDIFVAPFHTDTFGFVLLEAFAHGIPCVVADQFAASEIVTHGTTGLVIENHASRFGPDRLPRFSLLGDGSGPLLAALMKPPADYVDRLTAAIERLAMDAQARVRMGDAAYQEVVDGRFSVGARQRALADVYGSAA